MDHPIEITDELLTPRLILRLPRPLDLFDFFTYASTPGLGEMAGWVHHTDIEHTRRILSYAISRKNLFAIVLRETGKLIGTLGYYHSWGNAEDKLAPLRLKELGYSLGIAHWGLGLMPEAVEAAVSYGFSTLSLDAITCGHFVTNSRSKRVIEKSGFSFVRKGTYSSHELKQDFPDCKYIRFSPKAPQLPPAVLWARFALYVPEATRYDIRLVSTEQEIAPILTGQITAQISAHPTLFAALCPPPSPGSYLLLVGASEEGLGILQITRSELRPFRTVTQSDYARTHTVSPGSAAACGRVTTADESETDRHTEFVVWQTRQRACLAHEYAECGDVFTEDSLIVWEEFRLVYRP